jgi:hypothetical protein
VKGAPVVALHGRIPAIHPVFVHRVCVTGQLAWAGSLDARSLWMDARAIAYSREARQISFLAPLRPAHDFCWNGRNEDGKPTEVYLCRRSFYGTLRAEIVRSEPCELFGLHTCELHVPGVSTSLEIHSREKPPSSGTTRLWSLQAAIVTCQRPGDTILPMETWLSR